MSLQGVSGKGFLDLKMKSSVVRDFESALRAKVIGQDEAVQSFVDMYRVYDAGLTASDSPICNLLFLGPTGSGKTRIVEAAAEILFGSPQALIKVDCAEFQYGHEIAKLVGAPPGYVGYKEVNPILSQQAIDQHQTVDHKICFVLFDEIEKANDSLSQILLGILDKAKLRLGDNKITDLSKCVIVMTSNLGAAEMSDLVSGGIGFLGGFADNEADLQRIDSRMREIAVKAAKRNFSPEFINRLDKIVVFRTLTREHLWQILDLELGQVRKRILGSKAKKFSFECTPEAKHFLLESGTDPKYGARHLKRAINRHLVYPLADFISTGQILEGDMLQVDLDQAGGYLVFSKEPVVQSMVAAGANSVSDPKHEGVAAVAASKPLQQSVNNRRRS